MPNLDPLLAGVKRLAQSGILLPIQGGIAIVLNASTGATITYNANTGQYDLTTTNTSSGSLTPIAASSGTVTAANGQRIWCTGTVTVIAPAIVIGGRWGIKGGPGMVSITIPNASGTIEDPNTGNEYADNPIVLTSPGYSATWESDPTGAFWGLVG
jgi:hypothetical protein